MTSFDMDKFRLRRFVERLISMGEVDVHDQPVALADMSAIIEESDRATLFRDAGPQHLEIVGGVAGSRRRFATALETDERKLTSVVMGRLAKPQQAVEVPSGEAPVQQVVIQGDAIDLTQLPFHLQHERDGGCYISSGLDFTVDPVTGARNVGCRRLMLRGKCHMRTNLTDNSDLKLMYLRSLERKKRLPVAFVVGSYPTDFFGANLKVPTDELNLLATLRGEPMPVVRCVTNPAIMVPADAELVIEGYIDEQGYREMDGPYGEFWGYYGAMHIDPVVQVTAITMRRDCLHQTVLHGPQKLARQEVSHTTAVAAEMLATRTLRQAGIEPVAVFSPPSAPIFYQMRVALADASPEKARAAMEALFQVKGVRHITVVDDDIDVFNDDDMTWALATRFNADTDLFIPSRKLQAFYADPNADAEGLVSKVGFDCTAPSSKSKEIRFQRPRVPRIVPAVTNASVRQALEKGPLYFGELLSAVGSRDGREVAMELDALREAGELTRLDNGEYALMASFPGRQRVV